MMSLQRPDLDALPWLSQGHDGPESFSYMSLLSERWRSTAILNKQKPSEAVIIFVPNNRSRT